MEQWNIPQIKQMDRVGAESILQMVIINLFGRRKLKLVVFLGKCQKFLPRNKQNTTVTQQLPVKDPEELAKIPFTSLFFLYYPTFPLEIFRYCEVLLQTTPILRTIPTVSVLEVFFQHQTKL